VGLGGLVVFTLLASWGTAAAQPAIECKARYGGAEQEMPRFDHVRGYRHYIRGMALFRAGRLKQALTSFQGARTAFEQYEAMSYCPRQEYLLALFRVTMVQRAIADGPEYTSLAEEFRRLAPDSGLLESLHEDALLRRLSPDARKAIVALLDACLQDKRDELKRVLFPAPYP
jgi:hypothetical protein